jgi:hypothetical protein
MIDPMHVPAVSADEILARYIFHQNYVRSDQSIRPNAFMPPKDLELSVTRHLSATNDELWSVGSRVAAAIGKRLHGRGDVSAATCVAQTLTVRPDPVAPDNPNHAIVCDWPEDKPAQKIIAQEISASATYVPAP